MFKLDGTAAVAPYPKPVRRTIDLTKVSSTGDAKAGVGLFLANCSVCHGPNASGTYLPDLKTSPYITSSEEFRSVIIDGALQSQGMVSFKRFLSPEQAESVRAYLLTEARRAQALGTARPTPTSRGARGP